MFCPFTSTWTT